MFSLSGLLFAGQPQVIKVQTAQSKQMVTSGIRPLNTQAVRAIIKPNTDGTQVRIEWNTVAAYMKLFYFSYIGRKTII